MRSISQILADHRGVPLLNALIQGEPVIQDCHIWPQETRHCSMVWHKAYFNVLNHLHVMLECDRRTDILVANAVLSYVAL